MNETVGMSIEHLQTIKAALRRRMLEKLKSHKKEDRQKKSELIARKLFRLKEFLDARVVMLYLAFDGEVETEGIIHEIFRRKKRAAVPVVDRATRRMFPAYLNSRTGPWQAGPYGVPEPSKESMKPVALSRLDLIVVPGLAFDRAGNRLGRGKGYYDRFLNEIPCLVPTVGLAYDFQIVEDFPPMQPHDCSLTRVLFA